MAKVGRPKSTDEAIDKLARLKRAELDGMGDQRLENGLGRLYRRDVITEVEFLAGEAFRTLVAKYRRVKGFSSGRAKVGSFEPRVPANDDREYDHDYVRDVEDRYDELYLAITTSNGTKAMRLINDVCIEDNHCEWFNRAALRAALRTVAQKFRL